MKKFTIKTEGGSEFEMEVYQFLEMEVEINGTIYIITIKQK